MWGALSCSMAIHHVSAWLGAATETTGNSSETTYLQVVPLKGISKSQPSTDVAWEKNVTMQILIINSWGASSSSPFPKSRWITLLAYCGLLHKYVVTFHKDVEPVLIILQVVKSLPFFESIQVHSPCRTMSPSLVTRLRFSPGTLCCRVGCVVIETAYHLFVQCPLRFIKGEFSRVVLESVQLGSDFRFCCVQSVAGFRSSRTFNSPCH